MENKRILFNFYSKKSVMLFILLYSFVECKEWAYSILWHWTKVNVIICICTRLRQKLNLANSFCTWSRKKTGMCWHCCAKVHRMKTRQLFKVKRKAERKVLIVSCCLYVNCSWKNACTSNSLWVTYRVHRYFQSSDQTVVWHLSSSS